MNIQRNHDDLIQEVAQAIDDLPEEFQLPSDTICTGEDDDYPEINSDELPVFNHDSPVEHRDN